VARAPTEEPEGTVYEPELLSPQEESGLLRELETLRFDPSVLHGQAAKRTGRHHGLGYGSWEHSIPPTKERRYSITFRTLRNRG
jgi:hypothetical protein